MGQIVLFGGGQPVGKSVTVAAGEHLGERGDVSAEAFQGRIAIAARGLSRLTDR
ncbi:hypothetical protein [Nonomuraea sp. NPDC052265]|uniref:hypothetical protein n=1 Tax=Nonomuraea sp. NPDC052265 TaxID=3364374 RepID=UPI0037CB8A0A